MLINFCYEGLCEIESPQPSTDGHSISNLITKNSEERRKGFLVDSFVKPPVEITVKFNCLINLDHIRLNCSVGSQKSSVIQIVSALPDSTLKTVAKHTVEKEKKILCFHRNTSQIPRDCASFTYQIFSNAKYLCKVASVKVRILHTESSSIPALGELEIWGGVSKGETKERFDCIVKIWNEINQKKISPSTRVVNQPSSSKESGAPVRRNEFSDEFVVPDEFLDPITQEIFTLPMTLPSGKVVDISTIERFKKSEEKWGRGQSDPFTGLPFTDTRKPVVAASLKARLDRFLLQNSDQNAIKDIPRTTGRRNPPTTQTVVPSYAPYDPSSSSKVTKRSWNVNSILESTLAGLPSFLEKPVVKKVKTECIKCDGNANLFKFSCGHIMCRVCLLLVKNSFEKKCICGCDIDFNTIERYHPETYL